MISSTSPALARCPYQFINRSLGSKLFSAPVRNISNMFTQNCLSCQPVDKESSANTVFSTKHCRVILRSDDQSWLGRCLIIPKLHISSFEEFNEKDKRDILKDIYNIRQKINKVYKHIFGMSYDNWLQLGNLARDHNNKITSDLRYFHVHYHLIPRYEQAVKRFGLVFEDKQFGKALNIDPESGHQKQQLSKEHMQQLKEEIQLALIDAKQITSENVNEVYPSQKIQDRLNHVNSICQIYLTRHGETDWNVQGRMQGHTNIELNEQGIQQAHQLRSALAHIKFSLAYTSDLKRAQDTARIVLDRGVPLIFRKQLRERAMGSWEGRPKSEIPHGGEAIPPYQCVSKSEFTQLKLEKNIESYADVYQRFINFLKSDIIGGPRSGKTILVSSHGGLMRSVLYNLEYNKGFRWEVSNCASLKLEVEDSGKISIVEKNGVKLIQERPCPCQRTSEMKERHEKGIREKEEAKALPEKVGVDISKKEAEEKERRDKTVLWETLAVATAVASLDG